MEENLKKKNLKVEEKFIKRVKNERKKITPTVKMNGSEKNF